MAGSLFQQVVDAERSSVFLNPDEFAEPITLDGFSMFAIVDREDMEFPDVTDERMAVVNDAVTIRARKEQLESGKYQPGLRVMFNGEAWHVYSCDGGDIVTLKLFKERS